MNKSNPRVILEARGKAVNIFSISRQEMELKAMRYCYTPFRGVFKKYQRGYGTTRTLINYQWEFKLVQAFWKTVWQCSLKLSTNIAQDTSFPLLKYITQPKCILKHMSVGGKWYRSCKSGTEGLKNDTGSLTAEACCYICMVKRPRYSGDPLNN